MIAASVKMVTHSFKLFLALSVVLGLTNCSNSAERQVQLQKYYCPLHNDNVTIVYITATDNANKNIVHFIWSVYEIPSIIVGYTSKYNFQPHSKLNINCAKLTSKNPEKAISWKYDYATAFEIPEVRELNDPKDKVIFTETDFAKAKKHNIHDAEWKPPTFTNDQVTFEGVFLEGKITFTFNSSSKDGRGTEAPRQLYSNNGTRFSITLEKCSFNTTNTRVALKLLTHTETHPKENSTIYQDQSIDDEFSPGVFKTFVISHVINSTQSSFISWKPVSYTDEKKDLDTQIPSYQYNAYNEDSDKYKLYKQTKPTRLFSSKDKPSKIILAAVDVHKTFPLMISFGQKKDGWYQKSHYLTWSGQVGYFKPQFDSMSRTLMVTIFVGLGLPVAFILVGSIYVCFKKYRERMTASTYESIN